MFPVLFSIKHRFYVIINKKTYRDGFWRTVEEGIIGSRKSFLVGAIFRMGAEGICQCIRGGD